jgi:hypothetical protein
VSGGYVALFIKLSVETTDAHKKSGTIL